MIGSVSDCLAGDRINLGGWIYEFIKRKPDLSDEHAEIIVRADGKFRCCKIRKNYEFEIERRQ